LLQIQHLKED
jgi:hypothetical protein